MLSLWGGSDGDSWFNFDKIIKYRKLCNPENKARKDSNSNSFYTISIDVGRLHDQTVACVFRNTILEDKIYSSLVNLIVLGRTAETKLFSVQAIHIKKLIRAFNPREVLIDTNGLTNQVI